MTLFDDDTRAPAAEVEARTRVRLTVASDGSGFKGFAVHKLFEEVAPRYQGRSGGYTRILKLGPRRSDATEMVFLELV